MTEIQRVRSVWTGFLGGPGVTTMYFRDVATAVDSLHTFWDAVKGLLPNDVHIQVENAGDMIEDSTGNLLGAWSSDAVAVVDGAVTDKYSAPAGACINWLTDTIGPHRRLRGRSFLVPLANSAYQSDGTLDAGTITLLKASADAFIVEQATSFCIWHRGTGSDGTNGLVTVATVHDMVAVLRSRRD